MLPIAGFVSRSRGIPASPAEFAPDRSISAVSLNIAKESDSGKVVSAIHNAPRLRDADLFLLQEVSNEESSPSVAEETARKLGYFSSFGQSAPGVYDQGLALVSRYPIHDVEIKRLKACDLRFRDRKRFAIGATVRTPWGDLRVWNAHLDTRINAEERLEQLEPVIDEASCYTGPQLIGGDFNTNDLYWLRNVVPLPGGPSHGAAIRGAMKLRGFETPFPVALNTFPRFRRHLDWIFLRELRSLAASVEPAPFSDHNAIWVRVGL
ncbi:MAG: endonuclease/exonuclease/phosphatase family protein [Acidobacteriota bacterium]|nr:endonuclease/exonuclease/phosphatase family protein [Acidobacteriota bacterium]